MKLAKVYFKLTGWTLKMDEGLLWGDSEAIKLFSMREIFQVLNYLIVTHVIDYSCFMWMNNPITYVKMSIAGWQHAWVDGKYYSTHQRLNKEYLNNNNNKDWFEQWLVGMTDGDGTFCIVRQNGKWSLAYKITQSLSNLRVLYYIKKHLGYGRVLKSEAKQVVGQPGEAHFIIRDRKVLNEIIFPIFDKYPLLTCKYFSYLRFKKAYDILENNSLSTNQKNEEIKILLNYNKPATASWSLPHAALPDDYISPAIVHLNETSSHEEIRSTISAGWLVGFTEAKANFVISPDIGRFNIEYTLVHKLDKLLLQLIKRLLHIPSNVNYNSSKKIYVLNTKNSRVIDKIINLFAGKFKGMKSLEFKLWSRANYYKNTNLVKVRKIHQIVLKLRKKDNSL